MVPGVQNSLLNQYFQVKNALVAFNTMVNCKQSYYICGYATGSVMPPIGSVVAHNHVFNESAAKNNITFIPNTQTPVDVAWENNLMNQGTYVGRSFSASEVITGKDAKMVRAGTTTNMYEPSSTSALLNYTTNEYSEVNIDVRGRTRGTSKLPGASQTDGAITILMPSKTTAGASFTRPVTALPELPRLNNPRFITISGNTITSKEPGDIQVFNLQGLLVFRERNTDQVQTNLAAGFYIVRFTNRYGKQSVQKIVIH
jgi:hypothetical protein